MKLNGNKQNSFDVLVPLPLYCVLCLVDDVRNSMPKKDEKDIHSYGKQFMQHFFSSSSFLLEIK